MEAVQRALEQTQYLTFYLGGEEYAVGILQVKEIIAYAPLTPVPQTPPSLRGVINLRGSVVPVVDLAVRFGRPPNPVTNRTCIIVVEMALEGEQTVMGVVADAVGQVLELTPAEIAPPPPFGAAVRVDYLLGLGKVGKRFVLLLDITEVLAAPELQAATLPAATPPEGGEALPEGREARRLEARRG